MGRRLAWLAVALLLTSAPVAQAGEAAVPPPRPDAVCPVCGMFVAKFPEWVAVMVYKDGHAHYFDGAKDMFKFLAAPKTYVPSHRPDDVAAIAVTDYYAVEPMPARAAWYVIGSDVLGPMGHELVPLSSEAEAREFLRDHKGRAILRFEQVTAEVLADLDKGR
ncbi:MAG TPA: nitrous oxide reductase accessory protein NosL [Magnetospirillum sp.]|nr:nitrous oxide reductase accessory protein NosL [Magnetospirillum sp.]